MQWPGPAIEPFVALIPTQNWDKWSEQDTQMWYTLPAEFKEAVITVIFFYFVLGSSRCSNLSLTLEEIS